MPPRPKKPSAKLGINNSLLEAINFLNCVTKEQGTAYETHISLQYNTAIAYNDILSAGTLIEEDLIAAPNASILKKALSKCSNEYTLTLDSLKIIVKSGKFKAVVPCIDPAILATRNPDPISYSLDDKFKAALSCIDVIKPEPNAQDMHLLAFFINGPSIINTDGKIIIEYWHGLEMPTIAIPKSIIPSIVGAKQRLSGFGYSDTSVTFHFEDKSWIKSQLYAKPYPIETVLAVLDKNSNPSIIPPDFFPGLEAVASFSENGSVYFERDKICSHPTIEKGATFDVPGLPNGPIYTAKYLSVLKGLATRIDFAVSANGSVHSNNQSGYLLFWFGDKCRGVVAGHG